MSRKVSFADGAVVHEIDHFSTFSPEEIERSWYTVNDYREIRVRDAAIIISIVRKIVREKDEVDDDCIRGLEGRTPVEAEIKRTKFIESTYNVLDEQQRQIAYGISEPKKIASLYRKCTKSCAKAAKERARRDWQSINESEIASIEEEEEEVTLVDEKDTIPKKKQGPMTQILRFIERASSIQKVVQVASVDRKADQTRT
jgi:hypothetical protein